MSSQKESIPKVVYLATRHPFLTREQFLPRWREHGALATRIPIWRQIWRYEQDDALAFPEDCVSLVPGASDDYDGVGICWMREAGSHDKIGDPALQQQLRDDELGAFAEPVANFTFITEEGTKAQVGPCRAKLFMFIAITAGVDAPAILEELRKALLDDASGACTATKYVESWKLDLHYPGTGPDERPGLQNFDLCLELGFPSEGDMWTAIRSERFGSGIRPILDRLVDPERSISVAVRELCLYDLVNPSAPTISNKEIPSRASSEAALDQLLDREAIRDCLNRYTRGLDRLDPELARSAYHDDAQDDHGPFRGTGMGLIDWANGFHTENYAHWQHYISNVSIDLDGSSAHVESYFMFIAVLKDRETLAPLMGGRYVDRFEKRDDRWAIAARVSMVEWSSSSALANQLNELMFPAALDHTDLSYSRPLRVLRPESVIELHGAS
jgi:hypothetical protein